MGRAPRPFRRLWETDRGLSILLAIVVVILFVLPVIRAGRPLTRFVFDVALSMLLLAGIGVASERPRVRNALMAFVVVALALRWLEWGIPSADLDVGAAAAGLASTGLLAGVMVVRAFRGGQVTYDRILGAVAVYLLLGVTWAQAYGLLASLVPGAFNPPGVASGSPYDFFYYSVVTLTTVGYGDITPLHPIARSLAMLEALTGQLYPAILLARLVSLEVTGRPRE